MTKALLAIGVGLGVTAVGVVSAGLYKYGWKAGSTWDKFSELVDLRSNPEKELDDYSEGLRSIQIGINPTKGVA